MSWLGSSHKNCSVTPSKSTALCGPQFFSICVTRCLTTSCAYENIQFPGPALEVLIPEKKRQFACNAPLWVILMCRQLDTMARSPAHCADLRFCLKRNQKGKVALDGPWRTVLGDPLGLGGGAHAGRKRPSPALTSPIPYQGCRLKGGRRG